MIKNILDMLSYGFILKAVVVGLLISLCSSLLGVSLVLKHYSMIGDGLSHVAFGALAVATVANFAPLPFAIPIVIIAAVFLLRINESSKIKGDSAIAMISTGALAIGVMVISMTTGVNTDICNYMFGSILAMTKFDLIVGIILSISVIFLFVILYNRIFAVSFDESFAASTGCHVARYNMLIAVLTAVTVVIGMRMIGSLLMTSLIIFPSLTAMRIFKSFKGVVIVSAIVAIICFLVGIYMSYAYSAPPGACIVLVNIVVFAIFSILKEIKSLGGNND